MNKISFTSLVLAAQFLAMACSAQKSSSTSSEFQLCAAQLHESKNAYGAAACAGVEVTKEAVKDAMPLDHTAPLVFKSEEAFLEGMFVFEGLAGGYPVFFNYQDSRKLHRIDSLWAVSNEQRVLAFAEIDVKHPASLDFAEWTVSRRSGITTTLAHVRPLDVGDEIEFRMEAPVLGLVEELLPEGCYKLHFDWVSSKNPRAYESACEEEGLQVGMMTPTTFDFTHRGTVTARNGIDYVVRLSESDEANGPFKGTWYNVLEEDLLVAD